MYDMVHTKRVGRVKIKQENEVCIYAYTSTSIDQYVLVYKRVGNVVSQQIRESIKQTTQFIKQIDRVMKSIGHPPINQ